MKSSLFCVIQEGCVLCNVITQLLFSHVCWKRWRKESSEREWRCLVFLSFEPFLNAPSLWLPSHKREYFCDCEKWFVSFLVFSSKFSDFFVKYSCRKMVLNGRMLKKEWKDDRKRQHYQRNGSKIRHEEGCVHSIYHDSSLALCWYWT